MEIKLADYLKIETDIPLQYVEKFSFSWKPGCHASLKLEGYLDRKIPWDAGPSYNSRIKIWLEDERRTTIIYHGYIMEAELREEGKTNHVFRRHVCFLSAGPEDWKPLFSRYCQDLW